MDAEFWVAVAAVLISVVALIRGEILQRRGGPEAARRRAVENAAEALGAVVALIEHADTKMPPSSEISAVMQNFERECLRWGLFVIRGEVDPWNERHAAVRTALLKRITDL